MEHRLRNGVTLHVEDEGEGQPIVLLHGWSMSGRFFSGQLGGALAGHRVIVPDFRGHGRSEKVLHGHTVPTYAQDVRLLLEDLGIDGPILVGWSMGAMVALEYVKVFGDAALAGLGIVDQPPSDLVREGFELTTGFTIEGLAESVETIQTDPGELASEFVSLMIHDPAAADTSWMVPEMLLVPPAIASTILVDQSLRDYREVIRTVSCPTLVAFGRDAKLTPPAAGAWISEQIADSRFEIFESSSHCPFYEESDRFNEVLLDWVAAATSR